MPQRNKCPVCSEDFSSWSFLHHYATCFDQNTNSWLDHDLEADKTTERQDLGQIFMNIHEGIA